MEIKNFIDEFLKIVIKHSSKCFINSRYELIIEPKNNIYFRLNDIENELDLKCKVIAWLSRPSCKGVSNYWQKRIRNIINDFLGTNFSKEDMESVYTHLGNDCNRDKTIKFIKSNYNINILSA